jgi:ATP-dependent DNA helicase DinG
MVDSPRTQRVRDVLAASVRIATGIPTAEPRPGQLMLVDDMSAASDPLGGHMAGKAPTGVGKSLSGLSEAAVGVVDYGERWLMSTESIGLQAQYVDKDGPVVSKAAEEVLGRPVKVAMHKGWANYVCAMKARDTARQLGFPASAGESKIAAHAARVGRANLPAQVNVDGAEMPSATVQPLVAWALKQHATDTARGDRGHYEGATTDVEWRTVSVSPQECVGEDECPLAAICKPLRARNEAAEADIVITNHSMLAVQAATGTPVVIGNSKLGAFNGIIVDEAHTLPVTVRAQGQSYISGRRVMEVRRRVLSVADDRDPQVGQWAEDGKMLADYVDAELRRRLKGTKEVTRLAENDDPVAETGGITETWLRHGGKFAQAASKNKGDMSLIIQAKRVMGEVETAVKDLDSVRQHWVGTARWLEPPQPSMHGGKEWASVQSAPVNVGSMINRNLWNETVVSPDTGEEEQRPLSVACISATLTEAFPRDVGLKAAPRAYPTPFTDAYERSRLFIPRAVDDADVLALQQDNSWSKKPKFDTRKHREWAQRHIIDLVDANHGSALILAAKSADGQKYAAALRAVAAGRWQVYSQWDGENPRVITAKWKADPTAVMVGTKSMMTGVDAPGRTCSLVIVDRAPRAASNPVDDARRETLEEYYDKFTADRLVYVSDAALLLEQAAGRLIGSISDHGMVAVLDPRLLKVGPFAYSDPVRATYMSALEKFPNRYSDPAKAHAWLREQWSLVA